MSTYVIGDELRPSRISYEEAMRVMHEGPDPRHPLDPPEEILALKDWRNFNLVTVDRPPGGGDPILTFRGTCHDYVGQMLPAHKFHSLALDWIGSDAWNEVANHYSAVGASVFALVVVDEDYHTFIEGATALAHELDMTGITGAKSLYGTNENGHREVKVFFDGKRELMVTSNFGVLYEGIMDHLRKFFRHSNGRWYRARERA